LIFERRIIALLGNSKKGNLMDYVNLSKRVKISLPWRSKIAFLGNSKKGNFDGLCKPAKNDESFFCLGKQNCLFRKLLII